MNGQKISCDPIILQDSGLQNQALKALELLYLDR